MTIRYRVDLENTSGVTVASFSDFRALSFTTEVGAKGSYQFTISGFDSRRLLFDDDYLVRVYTSDVSENIPWREVFTGIHKTYTDSLEENGQRIYTSFGPDLMELLDKSYILYDAGSAEAAKSGTASSIMYEYVLENVGASATIANGRDVAGTNPITNFTDSAEGPTWDGSEPRKNLLTTLQKIRQYSINQADQIDFRVNYLGAYAFQFQAGAYNTDRTTDGLTPTSNGLNGAGNVPVVFAAQYNNVMSFVKSESRYSEANTIIALGQGEGAARQIATAQDGLAATKSPIAQRELITNAVNIDATDAAGLQAVADAKLDQKKAEVKFNWTPKRGALILFRDYFPGDFITGEDPDGNRQNKQVKRVRVNVSATSEALVERVTIKFDD